MTKTSWGLKRHCQRCGNRFYDLGKNPAACPKCNHMNDITAPYKPRRGRGKAAAKPVAAKPEKAAPKKVVKEIEGVDIEEFEDIETIDGDEDIEEMEDSDDIDTIEEIDDIEGDDEDGDMEDEVAGPVLVDDIEDAEEEEDDEDDEDEVERPRKSAAKKKPAPKAKKPAKAKPAPKKKK